MELEEQVTVHVKEEIGEDETDSGLVIRCDNEDSSDREDAAQHLLNFVNIQPKPPILKPTVRLKSPASLLSMDSSIAQQSVGHGSTGLFPPTEPWPGEFDFKLIIAEDMTKSSKKYHYNPILNKLYADMGAVINFQLHVTGILLPGTVARSTLVYKSHNDRSKPVLRCPNHSSPKEPSNMGEPEMTWPHVLRCLNDFNSAMGVQYATNPESGRLSVLAGLDAVIPGCNYFTKLYKFVCLGSCVGGIARRPLVLVVTLEDSIGDVIGRQTVDVRLCTCPLRDHNQDQAKLLEKTKDTKRPRTSNIKEKDLNQLQRFSPSNQVSPNKHINAQMQIDNMGTRWMTQDQNDVSLNMGLEVERVAEATNRFREGTSFNGASSPIYWVPVHSLENFKAVNMFAEYLDMTASSDRGEEFKDMRTSLAEAVNNLTTSGEVEMTNGAAETHTPDNNSIKTKYTSASLVPRVKEYSKSVLKTAAVPIGFRTPATTVKHLQNVTRNVVIPGSTIKANTSVVPSSAFTTVTTEQCSVTVLGQRSEINWNGMGSKLQNESTEMSKTATGGANDIKIELKEPVPSTSSGKRSWFVENAAAIVDNSKRMKVSDLDMVIVHNSDHVESAPDNHLEKSEEIFLPTTSPDAVRILDSKRVKDNLKLRVESGKGSDSRNANLETKQPGPTFLTYRDNSFVRNSALDGSDSEDSEDRIIRI